MGLEKLAHQLRGCAAAPGDALDARGGNDLGLIQFGRSHGVHDHSVLVQAVLGHLVLFVGQLHSQASQGQHLHDLLEGAQFVHGFHLLVHVLEGELAPHHGLHVHLLLRLHLLGPLDEGFDVTHAQHAGDEAVRLEPLQVGGRLAHSYKGHRGFGLGNSGESTAALGGAVQLGYYDAGDLNRLIEGPGLLRCLLAQSSIHDQ